MEVGIHPWDYPIVTASNERQANAYEAQLSVRRKPGLLSDIQEVIVVPDPGQVSSNKICTSRRFSAHQKTPSRHRYGLPSASMS